MANKKNNIKNFVDFSNLNKFTPTEKQQTAITQFLANKHLALTGFAGTGKTWLSLYMALKSFSDNRKDFKRINIIRSAVPSRDIGFLPGKVNEKMEVYESTYKAIVNELLDRGDAYDILVQKGILNFGCTSYLRGITMDDSIVILDEMQNCKFGELDTVVTRIGENSQMIFSGDVRQRDIKEESDLVQFLKILKKIPSFAVVDFTIEDIVRSDIVYEYILAREALINDGIITAFTGVKN